jgi:hypothetical protein
MFIPIRQVVYRNHPTEDYVWMTARVDGRLADRRSLGTLPATFEVDEGYTSECVIRTRRRVRWHCRGASKLEKRNAMNRLLSFHRRTRQNVVYISASPDLWYLKRNIGNSTALARYGLTLSFAAMHRLSELSRYDPKGLTKYLEGKENWLLSEFIELAPVQFLDELVCEMTSLEFGLPGIRPRSS